MHGTNVIIAVTLSLISLNVVAIGTWISITCLDNGSPYKRLSYADFHRHGKVQRGNGTPNHYASPKNIPWGL